MDAQARIVREMETFLHRAPLNDLLVVGHGAVCTLLLCHNALISRAHDQPTGRQKLLYVDVNYIRSALADFKWRSNDFLPTLDV